jgi:hypothetical protein
MSKLFIIAHIVALALLAPVAFASESEDQREVWPGPGFDGVVPGTHTICLEGFGTIECTSVRLPPDPEDCPPGQVLIAVRRFGNLSHVCARP